LKAISVDSGRFDSRSTSEYSSSTHVENRTRRRWVISEFWHVEVRADLLRSRDGAHTYSQTAMNRI
jgi:hypothetical protein